MTATVPGREGLPTATEMHTAAQAGWSDATGGRPRAAEHESYLGKDRHARSLSLAYNNGYSDGVQQALQDRYGGPPK